MTQNMKLISLLLLCSVLSASQALGEAPPLLKTTQDKISYGIGVSVAKNFQQQGIEVNPDIVIQGMRDVFAGGALKMNDAELRATMTEFQGELKRKQAKDRLMTAEDNRQAGAAFLEANAKKDGVVVLPSGLQYKILRAGNGKKPILEDTVECYYRGTLVNGTEFDRADTEDEPASFKVADVIPGWREALLLMPVGSKWQLFIPSDLAYGTRSAGRDIGPNATLIFEVELVAIR